MNEKTEADNEWEQKEDKLKPKKSFCKKVKYEKKISHLDSLKIK